MTNNKIEEQKKFLIKKINERHQKLLNKISNNIKSLESWDITFENLYDENKLFIFKNQLKRFKNGEIKPKLHSDNIKIIIKDLLKINIMYDDVAHEIVMLDKDDKEMTIINEVNKEINMTLDYDNLVAKIEDKLAEYEFITDNVDKLRRKINLLCKEKAVNRVKEFIIKAYELKKNTNLETNEIDRVFNCIKSEENEREINYLLFTTWLKSLIASHFDDDFISQGCLTFTGAQGTGKSTFFRNLIPHELRKYYEGEKILDSNKTDDLIECSKKWVVEMSEAGESLKNINSIKAHITKQYDIYRKPYDLSAKKYKRKTVYCASVDKEEYLKDDVNRRWWTIRIIDRFDLIEIDYIQLYAELFNLYMKNSNCYVLNWNEIQKLNEHNNKFSVKDNWMSLIENIFDFETEERYLLSCSRICSILSKKSNRSANTKIGLALKKLKIKYDIENKKTKEKLYHMPKPSKIHEDILEAFNRMKFPKVETEKDFIELEKEGKNLDNIRSFDSKKASK